MKTKKGKIAFGVVAAVVAVAIIAVSAIFIINSRYEYSPVDTENMLADGEKGTLTIYYNTADGMPESETVEYDKYDTYEFPAVEKKGYDFSGWVCNGVFCGNKMTLVSKTAWASPQFEKAYPTLEDVNSALYTDELEFTAYDAGEYPELDIDVADVYVDGGYKMTVYSKPDFKGKETKVYYTGSFSGHVGSMKVEAVESEGVKISELTDDARYELLKTYAPRIWWDENEEYFATTMENAQANLEREMSANGYTYVINEVTTPKFMNDYLYGEKDNAKAYAFATEKEHKYLDLSYFVYTPFNKAKKVVGMEFGDHIGDWEHVTVRLLKFTENGENFYRPVLLDYSTHNLRNYVTWDEIETVNETHPVAYTAWGSHGMWKDAGVHVYVNAVVVKLTDVCSEGTAWDLWEENQMETYSYDAVSHTGKGIGASTWDGTFDLDYANENSKCVTTWGNRGWLVPIQVYPRLATGPSGPEQKDTLTNYYSLNYRNTDKY